MKQVSSSNLGDSNSIYSKLIVASSTTLFDNDEYVILVNHSAPVTISLPSKPSDGRAFKIKDVSSSGALSFNITISGNGALIDNQPSDALINTDAGAIELVYDNSLTSWYSLAFIN